LPCTKGRSVALGTAGVGEAVTLHGDELPLVALRVQGELEHAVGTIGSHLAVGDRVRDLGVVASLGVACGLTEVFEVASDPFSVVLVVAGNRLGAPLEPPPRRPVAFLEVRRRASGVSLVAQGQDRR
jgi:hypothetical protein